MDARENARKSGMQDGSAGPTRFGVGILSAATSSYPPAANGSLVEINAQRAGFFGPDSWSIRSDPVVGGALWLRQTSPNRGAPGSRSTRAPFDA